MLERNNTKNNKQNDGGDSQNLSAKIVQLANLLLFNKRRNKSEGNVDKDANAQEQSSFTDKDVCGDLGHILMVKRIEQSRKTKTSSNGQQLGGKGVADGNVAMSLLGHVDGITHIRNTEHEGDQEHTNQSTDVFGVGG